MNESNYEEDQSSFTDRLNRLKNDRDNIQVPKQGSIDFSSDSFNDNFNNNFNDIQPSKIDKLKNNDIQPSKIDKLKNNDIQPSRIDKIKNENQQNIEYKNQQNIEYKNQQNNKEYTKKVNKLTEEQREIFNKLKDLNKNLLTQLISYKNQNIQLQHDNLELAEKLQEIIHKEKELDEKLKEINTKENELDDKYGNIINTKIYQLEINPDSSISSYRYNFSNTMNIIGIKLTSCSIPFKKYNIEDNINNLFLYTINNIEKNIIITPGYYTIEEIINNLNLNQSDIVFELNLINQKIKIISENIFNIVPLTLSIINLGFKSNCNGNSTYIADTIYDLRINNKVYLYFKNISDSPISIITPNTNIYDSEVLFENPVKLNYLDIEFKDDNDNNYNFYNINHYIHLNLMTNINNYLK